MGRRNSFSSSARISLSALLVLPLVGLSRLEAAVAPCGTPSLVIAAGTAVPVTLDENVEVKRDQIGNTFPGHLTRNIVANGVIAVAAGAPVELALVENQASPGSASFRLVRISIGGSLRPVRTDVGRADAASSHGLSTGKKTGLGAAAGGVLGLILGGGSGLLKGAVVGAGGGLAWGLLDQDAQRVEVGSSLLFTLLDPIRVS